MRRIITLCILLPTIGCSAQSDDTVTNNAALTTQQGTRGTHKSLPEVVALGPNRQPKDLEPSEVAPVEPDRTVHDTNNAALTAQQGTQGTHKSLLEVVALGPNRQPKDLEPSEVAPVEPDRTVPTAQLKHSTGVQEIDALH